VPPRHWAVAQCVDVIWIDARMTQGGDPGCRKEKSLPGKYLKGLRKLRARPERFEPPTLGSVEALDIITVFAILAYLALSLSFTPDILVKLFHPCQL